MTTLTQKTFKVGTRVKCINKETHAYFGKTGSIEKIVINSGSKDSNQFFITWDVGGTYGSSWGCLDSFEVIDSTETLSEDKPQAPKEDNVLKENILGQPCPKCYYGIGRNSSSCVYLYGF